MCLHAQDRAFATRHRALPRDTAYGRRSRPPITPGSQQSSMVCPACQSPMSTQRLDGHHGQTVDVDHCAACQVWWFDEGESLKLSPRGTLMVCRVIGERATQSRRSLPPVLACPRCALPLRLVHDRQRNVAFQYRRCSHGHGRLITDLDLLRQKNIIRPLTASQLDDLRARVHTVNCTNCGGPIDIGTTSECGHCGSPLSMIDLQQAGDVIAQLQKADTPPAAPDPLLPLRLAAARREVEQAFAGHSAAEPSTEVDLLGAGLRVLADWLKR